MPTWFAVIPPGLEPALVAELREKGIENPVVQPGGARFEAGLEQGARLAGALRTPSRLLLELAHARASSLEGVGSLARSVNWKPYLEPGIPVNVECSARESRVRFPDAISRKLSVSIQDALRGPRLPTMRSGRPPEPQRVTVRLQDNIARLSIDAGGELLHMRGWRRDSVRAPIRENLASALLYIAKWDPSEPLYDPFCGSGTIPIEAALRALGAPPAQQRRYAWQDWPALRGKSPPPPAKRALRTVGHIWGSDKEGRALAAAVDNASRAGVSLSWAEHDIADVVAPAELGLIVANPPYGERLGQSVEGVYSAFGRVLRERFGGWRVLFLAPHAGLAQRVDRDCKRLLTFSNGGIRVGAWSLTVGG